MPARARRSAGFTLVELLVSTLILVIVATGWFTIMNATSPYREAQRRAAIEVAAGVLDTFFPDDGTSKLQLKPGHYRICEDADRYPFEKVADDSRQKLPQRLFPVESPIRYVIRYAQFKKSGGIVWDVTEGAINPPRTTDYRALMWMDMAERIRNEYWEASGSIDGAISVFTARIALYDSEKSEKPFAEFEQLVGIGDTPHGYGGK